MKQFECINTFTSQKGEYYAKGTKIYENEFYTLSKVDKPNFKEVTSDLEEFDSMFPEEDSASDKPDNLLDDLFDDQPIRDSDSDSDNDFDFGDGDTGGAGASDDF